MQSLMDRLMNRFPTRYHLIRCEDVLKPSLRMEEQAKLEVMDDPT